MDDLYLKWVRPVDSTIPWAMMAPVETTASTMPRSIMSQMTRPILAGVIAPERVRTLKQSSSSTIVWMT